MHEKVSQVKRALISVSDKKGIVEFARALTELKIEILSTGGTSKLLRAENISVRDVSDLTKFPEMMDGRVKTLHPKVHGGILGLRDEHKEVATENEIEWIDLVVVNLYPFAETVQKENVTFDEAIENIDIGGPTMIRSAAKNMGWVGVVVSSNDYPIVVQEIKNEKGLTFATRKQLALKAFQHTAEYDGVISNYLSGALQSDNNSLTLQLKKICDLRYGENPQQTASAFQFPNETGILSAKQYQGKELSYNNIADADAAMTCVREFDMPACVIVKHANPCGVAIDPTIEKAFERAFAADSVSAFGGIVALNRECSKELAEQMISIFFEVIVAPSFSPQALEIFSKKENLRILQINNHFLPMKNELKFIEGGLLMQSRDFSSLQQNQLKIVTNRKPDTTEMETLLFAWKVIKHIKSNAILIARENQTVGVGAGQVSRIDAVELAIKKSKDNLKNAVLASDAFFPFKDSIDCIRGTGIQAIIQPGGSMRDAEVIAACDENDIAMVFTGQRCFKH